MNRRLPLLMAFAVLGFACAAQRVRQGVDPAALRSLATRDSLRALEARLQDTNGGDAATEGARSSTLGIVRARLRDGDFGPGDRVLVQVQGESTLTDTFMVSPARELMFPQPVVGTMPLGGLLRSELEDSVAGFLSRFVRDPVVRAQPLIRLSVQGEVARAGFYDVPADAGLSDALMAAGGTTPRAKMEGARVIRNGERYLEGDGFARALASGSTLDQAHLLDGDEIFIASRPAGGVESNLRFVLYVVSIAGGVYGLSRAF